MNTPKTASSRFPSQVKFIVGNEACERFSYYGMRSILAGYITGKVLEGGLGQTTDKSTEIIHLFVAANYFMPLLGAWLSDKIIGRYHTILWVSLFYCAGHGVLACSDFMGGVDGRLWCLYAGLALIAFGSGGIKPCVSAFMGDQFGADQSHLLQKAYGAFYWAINFGSFFSFLVIPWVKDSWGFSLAFGVPGILMALATLIFWLGTKHYVRVPPNRKLKRAGFFKVFWSAFRTGGDQTFAAGLNVFTTLGLPVLALIAMTYLVLSDTTGGPAKVLGWTAVGCVGVWYLLVLVLSVMRKMELPDAFWRKAAANHSDEDIAGARSLSPILFIFAFVPVFWTLFDQTNSTWVKQGEQMLVFRFGEMDMVKTLLPHWTLVSLGSGIVALLALLFLLLRKTAAPPATAVSGGSNGRRLISALVALIISGLFTWLMFYLPKFKIGAEQMQSANSAIVMLLVPLLTLWLYPRIGRLASPLKRMSCGMFLAAASYLVVAALQTRIEAGAQLSVLWQVMPYVVLTTAEVLFSTTGLEFAFREAAPQLKSTIMSFWLMTVCMGNFFVVTMTKLFSDAHNDAASVSTKRFLQYAGLTFVVAILFSLVAAFYRYRDSEAAQGR